MGIYIGNNACKSSTFSGCTTPFFSQGCPAGGAAFSPPTDCSDPTVNSCFMYLKILDRYYSDNFGQYNIRFKQGVIKPSDPGIVTKFVGMVQSVLCDDTQSEFTNFVQEQQYLTYIRVFLILYITFLGIGYLSGFVEFTSQELMMRVFKIALVVQISTTDSSWSFFYNYFFKFFQQGIGEVTGIIFGDAIVNTKITIPGIPATSDCQFQNLSGFASFDKVIKELLSYETSRKILSLIAWKGGGYVGGALLVLIMYIMIALVLFILLKSVMIYVMSYLTISLLIILSPVFIPFILFKVTRHWFDGWLKNLISYFIQPIIILTFAFFLIQIFMYQMHYLFGYRVCFKEWFNFVGVDPLNIPVYAWQTDFKSGAEKQCIFTPNSLLAPSSTGDAQIQKSCTKEQITTGNCRTHVNLKGGAFSLAEWPGPYDCTVNNNYYNNQTSTGTYCAPFSCTQKRYVDYPYLDPEITSDQSRITELQNDQLMSLKDLGIFVLIVWFMMQFNNVVPSIARKISGNPQSFADMAGAGAALGGSVAKWSGMAAAGVVNKAIYRPLSGGRRDLFKDVRLARKRIADAQDATVNYAGEKRKEIGAAVDEKLSNTAGIRHIYKAAKFSSAVLNPDDTLKKGINAASTAVQNAPGIRHAVAAKDTVKEYAKWQVEDKSQKAVDAYKSAKETVQEKVAEKTDPLKAKYNETKTQLVNAVKAAPGIRHGIAAKNAVVNAKDKAVAAVKSAPGIRHGIAAKNWMLGKKPSQQPPAAIQQNNPAQPQQPGVKPQAVQAKPAAVQQNNPAQRPVAKPQAAPPSGKQNVPPPPPPKAPRGGANSSD